jgi:hypothetical protein
MRDREPDQSGLRFLLRFIQGARQLLRQFQGIAPGLARPQVLAQSPAMRADDLLRIPWGCIRPPVTTTVSRSARGVQAPTCATSGPSVNFRLSELEIARADRRQHFRSALVCVWLKAALATGHLRIGPGPRTPGLSLCYDASIFCLVLRKMLVDYPSRDGHDLSKRKSRRRRRLRPLGKAGLVSVLGPGLTKRGFFFLRRLHFPT